MSKVAVKTGKVILNFFRFSWYHMLKEAQILSWRFLIRCKTFVSSAGSLSKMQSVLPTDQWQRTEYKQQPGDLITKVTHYPPHPHNERTLGRTELAKLLGTSLWVRILIFYFRVNFVLLGSLSYFCALFQG